MLGDTPEVKVKLTEKFWAWCEANTSTMLCVLRERGIETAMLLHIPGAPRFRLRFPGVGGGEAPEFDRQIEPTDGACKVFDCEPGCGPGDLVEAVTEA